VTVAPAGGEPRPGLGAYRWRIVGGVLALFVYGLLVLGAIAGAPDFAAVVVTIPVLVFLIAAGNGLQHWLGIKRRSPQYAERVRDDEPRRPQPT
jgi:hypothetical protein